MRIAFDLDNTLIPSPGSTMPVECLDLLTHVISRESVRLGARDLFRRLHLDRHEVWIYTTSLRKPARLRAWFWASGIRLDGIVNQTRHDEAVRDGRIPAGCSKYQPAFSIDMLIDDSEGVAAEGRRLDFSVLHDAAWCSRIEALVRAHPAMLWDDDAFLIPTGTGNARINAPRFFQHPRRVQSASKRRRGAPENSDQTLFH